jgi:hypothetical protein
MVHGLLKVHVQSLRNVLQVPEQPSGVVNDCTYLLGTLAVIFGHQSCRLYLDKFGLFVSRIQPDGDLLREPLA